METAEQHFPPVTKPLLLFLAAGEARAEAGMLGYGKHSVSLSRRISALLSGKQRGLLSHPAAGRVQRFFPLPDWPITLLASLLWVAQPVAAVESVEIAFGQLSGPDWRIENLRLRLSLDPQAQPLFALSADRLIHPALPHALTAFRIDCNRGGIDARQIRCDQGVMHLQTPLLEQVQHAFSFTWQVAGRRLAFSLPQLEFAEGQMLLEAEWREAGWRLAGKGAHIDLAKAAARLGAAGLSLPVEGLGGQAGFEVTASGDDSGVTHADWDMRLEGVTFADASGDYAGAGLIGNWRGRMSHNANGYGGGHAVRLAAGEILTPAFYLAADKKTIRLDADIQLSAGLDHLAIDRLAFEHPDIVAFESSGALQLDPTLKPLRWELSTRAFDPGALFTAWLQPVLTEPFFEQLQLAGRVRARASLSDSFGLELDLEELTVAHGLDNAGNPGGNFRVQGVNGNLRWAQGRSSDSHLSWRGGELFGGIGFGPADLKLSLDERGIVLREPAQLPLLDGSLQAEQFEFTQTETGPRVAFRGFLTPISMQLFSQAVGWPPLAGQISGMIPGVSFQEGALQVDGVVLVRLFGGRVLIRDLSLTDLFGALPILSASIEVKDIDLETLTSTFSFGRITGKLEGRVDGLQLEDWRPVAFDAQFATPSDDDSRHRISQKAVDNISNLGGAGVAGAISRSFLSIFEEFGYHQLGISCRLSDGICHMGGVAPAPQGYYLVKGGGIPRINIVGFNRRTDWQVLIEKLQQVTEGGAPVVQ
jgi:hypothetical protein